MDSLGFKVGFRAWGNAQTFQNPVIQEYSLESYKRSYYSSRDIGRSGFGVLGFLLVEHLLQKSLSVHDLGLGLWGLEVLRPENGS